MKIWLGKFEYVNLLRLEYRRVLNEDLQRENSMRYWEKQQQQMDSFLDKKGSRRPSLSADSVKTIGTSLLHSPRKSVP